MLPLEKITWEKGKFKTDTFTNILLNLKLA